VSARSARDGVASATRKQILSCPMDPNDNDAGATNVGEYLAALLGALWAEEEEFSGERPLGNSDWQMQVYVALEAEYGHTGDPVVVFDPDIYKAIKKALIPKDSK
jgi:hypothetical protein